MTSYVATMMDAETGAQGTYPFEADAQLFEKTPVRIVRLFMEHVDKDLFPKHHLDYEINACLKSREKRVVTAIGSLHFEHEPASPFMLMIADAK